MMPMVRICSAVAIVLFLFCAKPPTGSDAVIVAMQASAAPVGTAPTTTEGTQNSTQSAAPPKKTFEFYYRNGKFGDYILLDAKGTFELAAGPGSHDRGTYTVDGSVITFAPSSKPGSKYRLLSNPPGSNRMEAGKIIEPDGSFWAPLASNKPTAPPPVAAVAPPVTLQTSSPGQLSLESAAPALVQESHGEPSILNVRHVHGQFNFMVASHGATIRIDANSFSFDPLGNRCNRKLITIPFENILELQILFEPLQGPNQVEFGRGYRFYNNGAWLAFPEASALNQSFRSYNSIVFGVYVKALKPGSPKDTVDFTFTDSDTNIPTPGVYPGPQGSWPYGTGISGKNYEIVKEIALEFQRRIERNVLAKEETERREAARLEAERRALPADLKASVQFDDSQSTLKTGRLDAGKKAELVITVENQGQGPAYDVVLALTADNTQVVLPAPQTLGEIPPGQSRQLRLPIEAPLTVPSAELNVLVEAKERRGYNAQKVKLVIPMARLDKPSLSIENVLINDGTTGLARGNGNKIPESGETVELIVFVKNSGVGPAAAELSLISTDPGIELVKKATSLGLIQPNQTVQGILVLGIPRTYASRNASLNIRVADTRGEGVATATRQMPLSVSARAPGLAISSRIISRGAELQELTNDQTVELELTPENSGTLDAVDVVVKVSASGVVFRKSQGDTGDQRRANPFEQMAGPISERSQATVGALRAGEKGLPERFELTVPRAFMKDRLPVAIELSQKDFPALTTIVEVPVKTRRPLLSYKFYVLGRVGGTTIEQNETADLEIQIINNGGLMAKDVQAAVSAATPGVEIQGDKMARVGVIAPQSQAVVRFRIHLLRSVKPGELPVDLNILQSDFSSIIDTISLKVSEELAEVKRVETPTAPVGRPLRHKPVIALAKPSEGDFVREKIVDVIGTIADDKGISRLDITVNGRPLPEDVIGRGLRRRASDSRGRDQQDFNIPLALDPGPNEIRIAALNTENETEVLNVRVTRLEDRGTPSVPTLLPQSDVDRYILSFGAVRPDPRRWAVVIGIEQYRKTASVPFATRDAYAMREYAIRVLGVPTEQVFLLTDDQATKAEMMLLLEERLQEKVRAGDTVYVYFAGHGIPEVKDGTPYLLPADGDPQSPRITGYSLEDVYVALGKLKAEKVAIFLDACFSGLKARDELRETLLPGTRPGVIRVKNPVMRFPNLISFAGAGNDELSNAYRKEAHGLFTYFLLKGLSGGARMEGKGLLLSELSKYVISQVSRTSREVFGVNQHQTPIVAPDIDPARDIVLKEK